MNCATLPLPWLLTPVDAKVKKDREKISLGKARPYRETKLVCKTDPPTFFSRIVRPYREKVTQKIKLNQPHLFIAKLLDKVGLQL